jgi:hypothetical protein
MLKARRIVASFIPIIPLLFTAGVNIAFAQGSSGNLTLQNPLGSGCTTLSCPLTAITNFLFTISIPICGIMILVGGFQMMTAGGNPEKFSSGRKTILYAVIGFVVVLLAGSVAALIQSLFGGNAAGTATQ